MNIEDLLHYFQANRRTGCTHLMLHGVLHSDNPCIVLAANEVHARELRDQLGARHRSTAVISIHHEGDVLRGRRNPIAIDNFAMVAILSEAVSEQRKLIELFQAANNEATAAKALATRYNSRYLTAQRQLKALRAKARKQ